MSQLPITPQGTPPVLLGRLQAMLRGLKGDKGDTGDVTPEAIAARDAAEGFADGAALAKTGADGSATLSGVNAAAALAAASVANVGAAASIAGNGSYTTTAQGLAATTNGQLFLLKTADPLVYDIYTNTAGAAVYVDKFAVASALDAANAKNQFNYQPPVNIYNPALAEDQFIYSFSTGAKQAFANGIASGPVTVQEGVTYTFSQPDTERGFLPNVHFFAGTTQVGMASAASGATVIPGANPIYSNPGVASGQRRVTFTVPTGFGITNVKMSMLYNYLAHTTGDFDRIRNGVQFEVGGSATTFRPYLVAAGALKQSSMPPPVFNIGQTSVTKAGNTLYVRGYFDATRDIIQQVLLATGNNNTLNAQGAKTCLKTETDNALAWANGTALDVQNDSTAPMYYNGTFMGGNHGANFLLRYTAAAHGKTVEDVGRDWLDGAGRRFTLMRLPDANTVDIMSENIAPNPAIAPQWMFATSITGTTLTNTGGALHPSPINVTGVPTVLQLWPSLQDEVVSVVLDSAKTLTADGTYYGSTVDFVDQYRIARPDKVVDYVRSQAGGSTQPVFNHPSIESDVSRSVTYRYAENGSCTIYDNPTFLNPASLSNLGSTQAQALDFSGGKQLWQYVVRALAITVGARVFNLQNTENITVAPTADISVTSGVWSDANNPPDRLAQIVKSAVGVPETVLCVGYSPTRSIGTPSVRKTLVNVAMYISPARKQYPQAVSLGPVAAGTSYGVIAFRTYAAAALTPQATICAWYRDGKAVILMGDFHQNVTRSALWIPQQFVGMDMTVIDKTASLTVHGTIAGAGIVPAGGPLVSVTGGYGYVVLKLS